MIFPSFLILTLITNHKHFHCKPINYILLLGNLLLLHIQFYLNVGFLCSQIFYLLTEKLFLFLRFIHMNLPWYMSSQNYLNFLPCLTVSKDADIIAI